MIVFNKTRLKLKAYWYALGLAFVLLMNYGKRIWQQLFAHAPQPVSAKANR
jgi:hypothetical protein